MGRCLQSTSSTIAWSKAIATRALLLTHRAHGMATPPVWTMQTPVRGERSACSSSIVLDIFGPMQDPYEDDANPGQVRFCNQDVEMSDENWEFGANSPQ